MTSSNRLLLLLMQLLLLFSKTHGQRNNWSGGLGHLSGYNSRFPSLGSHQAAYGLNHSPRRFSDPLYSSSSASSGHRSRDPYLDNLRYGGRQSPRYDFMRDSVRLDSISRMSSLGMGMMDSQFQQNSRFDTTGPMNQFQAINQNPSSLHNFQNGMMNPQQGPGMQHQLNMFGGVQQHRTAQPTFTTTNIQPNGMQATNVQTASIVPTFVQGTPTNVVPVLQQNAGTPSILPVVIQQTPQVVPAVVGVATTPVQTMVPSLSTASQPQFNLGNIGGFSSGLGNNLFSGMPPVIIKMKMEDMPPQSPMPGFGGRSSSPIGEFGPGSGVGSNMSPNNPTGDPRISVVKLDEGLNIVINYSDPHGNIMNLPAPSNEEEATMLMGVLERAEAPEYIKSMIRIRPRANPDAVAAAAAANNAAMANAAAAAAGAAMAAATAPVITAPVVSGVANPVAALPAMQVAALPASPIVAAPAVVAPAPALPAAVPAVVTGPAGASIAIATAPAAPGGAALPVDFTAYDDVPIDEIIANAFVGAGTGTGGGSKVVAGANYPMDGKTANGRFMLTSLDMELTPTQYAELHSPTPAMGRVKRKAITNHRTRWPGGIVPYEIRRIGFTPMDRRLIMEALTKWSSSTCISFRPANRADLNKLVFKGGRGCSSNVGMIGGTQYLTLQRECRIPKIIAHEIGHALGLIHEHQRRDRDNYLKINYHNIKPGTNKDFDMFKPGSVDDSIAPYDYMSIMHYGKTAFAKQQHLITMEAVDPRYTNLMGRATTLSPSDWTTVNVMYGCGGSSMGFSSSPTAGLQAAAAAASPAVSIQAQAAIVSPANAHVVPANPGTIIGAANPVPIVAANNIIAPAPGIAAVVPANSIPLAPVQNVMAPAAGQPNSIVAIPAATAIEAVHAQNIIQPAAPAIVAPAPINSLPASETIVVAVADNPVVTSPVGQVPIGPPKKVVMTSGPSIATQALTQTGGVAPSIIKEAIASQKMKSLTNVGQKIQTTDMCAGFTKYCQVDHDLVYSVLGPQVLAKCGHMCLKNQRG